VIQGKKIQVHPRPTTEEIYKKTQEILALPSGPKKDIRLSQAWFLGLPADTRNKIFRTSPDVRLYFSEIQRSHPGWLEEDFSILHIAATGETPIY
jgi:hypothetical protein